MLKTGSLGQLGTSSLVILCRERKGWRQVLTGSNVSVFSFDASLADIRTAFFMSLAAKTKLHPDKPRAEEFNREALLDYYNQFPSLAQYARIKPKHFARKDLNTRHRPRSSKVVLAPGMLAFGTLTDELEMEDVSGDDNEDDEDDERDKYEPQGTRPNDSSEQGEGDGTGGDRDNCWG